MRVVLDTNVLVSALIFTGISSELVPLWQRSAITVLLSRGILEEYLRVLSYPKFQLSEAEIKALIEEELLPNPYSVASPVSRRECPTSTTVIVGWKRQPATWRFCLNVERNPPLELQLPNNSIPRHDPKLPFREHIERAYLCWPGEEMEGRGVQN